MAKVLNVRVSENVAKKLESLSAKTKGPRVFISRRCWRCTLMNLKMPIWPLKD